MNGTLLLGYHSVSNGAGLYAVFMVPYTNGSQMRVHTLQGLCAFQGAAKSSLFASASPPSPIHFFFLPNLAGN